MIRKNSYLLWGCLFLFLLLAAIGYAQGERHSFLPLVQRSSSTPTATSPAATATATVATATATTIATVPPAATSTPMPTATRIAEGHTLTYYLDRTAVPAVAFPDITLKIFVGDIADAQLLTGSGQPIPYHYDATSQEIIFTTAADLVRLTLVDAANPEAAGPFTIADLKDDKQWAWSHGFDDNQYLQAGIAEFEERGWRGTLFMIAYTLEETRDEDWIIDVPAMHRLIANGWSVGNHSWGHECNGGFDYRQTILDGYARIADIVQRSARPDYRITSFAAPCFDAAYHPYILQMRDAGETAVLFNESGGPFKTLVSANASGDYEAGGKTAVLFNPDAPIGRDTRIEWDMPNVMADIEWIANNSSSERHIWYNSITHGHHEAALDQLLSHVYNNYGPNGSNTVWVAPSDQIYNYLLVRDNIAIRWEAPDAATTTPTPTPSPTADPGLGQPQIDIANSSGVAGHEIGIFGRDFGANSGSVTILGQPAPVLEWRDSFIRAQVPNATAASGDLVVRNQSGQQASHPFTVYTIDPRFLTPPATTFVNIAHGKTAFLQNMESYFCFTQPENSDTPPSQFLADYRCGFAGVTDTGSAVFTADPALGKVATIAIDLGETLAGTYYFQFFTDSNWYPDGGGLHSVASDYELQVSADSTDGLNGNWTTVQSVVGNGRLSRLHKLTIPAGNHHWLRMRVSNGLHNLSGPAGNDFELKEIRLYKPMGSSQTQLDSLAIYGDSLTQAAFEAIGPSGLATAVQNQRATSQDLIFTPFGLSGQNSTGLTNLGDNEADIYDALTLDDMVTNALYWGIALGTNDTFGGSANLGVPHSNVELFDERLDAVVQYLLANGRFPLLARIPDTIEARGGYGDLATKQKILSDIDTIAARYRLIPGPDLYTTFRYNNDFGAATYFGDDGIHHTPAGEAKLIELWAEALVQP